MASWPISLLLQAYGEVAHPGKSMTGAELLTSGLEALGPHISPLGGSPASPASSLPPSQRAIVETKPRALGLWGVLVHTIERQDPRAQTRGTRASWPRTV